ncbi:MAG: MATE family efflux transporter [Lachnospiraceae bacterium]|nr:MATE family efflux transporter [Lachnospiraceae bacterium]
MDEAQRDQNEQARPDLFSDQELKKMIVPLFLEQLLVMLVGLADTLVISYAGESAVSGVSLVNQFNTIFIYLFTALASGGAVVISQYIGRQDTDLAGESASQLLMFSFDFSVLLGAAVYRSLGKTNVTMYLSVVSNVINVIGNVIGVFVFRAGVAGVAWPSFLARVFSAVTITFLCFREKNRVVYRGKWIFSWHGSLMKSILNVAIPNGVENGIFQLVKVALSSIVTLFGTYQIAANGVAQSIWSLAALAGVAMGPVFLTVIGQCMGTGNTEAAEYHFKKLTKLTLFVSAVWNLLVFILTPVFLHFYSLSPETKRLVVWLVLIHNVFNAAFYPFSGALSNGLRAAGDVKFTMYVSVVSTVAVRLLLAYLLGITLQMGVIGIALAMVCDWVVRAVLFIWRERTGKWKTFQVIKQ